MTMEPTLKTSSAENAKKSSLISAMQFLYKMDWPLPVLVWLLTACQLWMSTVPAAIGFVPGANLSSYFKSHGKEYSRGTQLIVVHIVFVPAIVTTIIGGMLADRVLGISKTLLLAQVINITYAVLFQLGILFLNVPLILIAASLKGISGSIVSTFAIVLLTRWFKSRHGLTLSLGIIIAITHLFEILKKFYLNKMIMSVGTSQVFLVEIALQLFCLVPLVVALWIDHSAVRSGKIRPISYHLQFPSIKTNWQGRVKEFLSLPAKVPAKGWLAVAIFLLMDNAFIPIIKFWSRYLSGKYPDVARMEIMRSEMAFELAVTGSSLVICIALEMLGRFSFVLISGGVLCTLWHMLFIFFGLPHMFYAISFGLVYGAVAVAFWTTLQLVSPDSLLCTINGLAAGLLPAMFTICNTIASKVRDSNAIHSPTKTNPRRSIPTAKNCNLSEILFLVLALCATLCSALLFFLDTRGSRVLCSSAKDRIHAQQEETNTHLIDEVNEQKVNTDDV